MRRAPAVAVLLLAAGLAGCREPDRTVAPAAARGALEGNMMPLVVEADLPIARLVVAVEDGSGRRETEIRRDDEKSVLAGAIDMAPGTKARVSFSAFDGEGHLTHSGEGTLVTGTEITPQREYLLTSQPGAGPATVRIGSYRLAMSELAFTGMPGNETRFEAVLLDARGERHPMGKGGLQWVPMGPQEGLGRASYEQRDEYVVSVSWTPEKYYVGRLRLCTYDYAFCGKIIVWDPNPVVQLVTAAMHTCALRKSGVATCFGDNVLGQAAYEAGVSQIGGITFKSLGTANSFHTCGVDVGGNVYCWGAAPHGELGHPMMTAGTGYPQLVPGLPAAALQVTTGNAFSCALLVNGETWCWGVNNLGQLGDSTAVGAMPVAGSASAVRVRNAPVFMTISAGSSHTCGLTSTGVAWCWGANASGQAGIAPASSDSCGGTACLAIPRPVQTVQFRYQLPLRFASINGGGSATCARTSGGTGYCWGALQGSFTPNGGNDHIPRTPTSQPSWKQLMTSGSTQCGVDTADMAQCFGSNGYGRAGIGMYSVLVATPTPVALVDAWTTVDVGGEFACGVRGGGYTISCWGWNLDGQLGLGYWGGSSATPVNVTEPY